MASQRTSALVGGGPHPGGTDRCVIFLHLPKTAGTTLAQIMRRQYRPGELLLLEKALTAHEDFERLPSEARARLRGIQGHVLFGIHDGLSQPWTYVTLVRDPVDRVLSLYSYVWAEPRHPLHARVREEDVDLERFVRDDLSAEAVNGQTRRVAGTLEQVDRATLGRAISNLERHFAVVGVTERFDESLVLLQRTLGWRSPYYAPLNVTRERLDRADLAPRLVRLIEERNALDGELHEVAKRLFREGIESQGPRFGRRVAAFRRANRLYGPAWNAARRARKLARRVLGPRPRARA